MEKKPKLLIATDNFLPRWDGISRFLKEIIPALSKKFDVVVVAPKFDGNLPEFKDIKLVRIPLSSWKAGDYQIAQFRRVQMKKLVSKADIVWTQTIGPIGILAMWYARRLNKKSAAFVHSIEWELFSKSIKRFKKIVEYFTQTIIPFLYNRCDVLMIPYSGLAEVLRRRLILSKKEVVPLGTNSDKFIPPQNKKQAKQEIGVNPKKFVIGYVGRIGREKDLDTLYDAFRKVNQDYENTELVIVGGGVPLQFDNMKDVMLVGPTNKVIRYYQALDVYVLPSMTETTSLTTMEAMSCGVPVVVTPVGYLNDYVKEKENGMLFPLGNSERLALILKKLMKNSALRSSIGRNGRKTVLQKFIWGKTTEKVISLLNKLVDGSDKENTGETIIESKFN